MDPMALSCLGPQTTPPLPDPWIAMPAPLTSAQGWPSEGVTSGFLYDQKALGGF